VWSLSVAALLRTLRESWTIDFVDQGGPGMIATKPRDRVGRMSLAYAVCLCLAALSCSCDGGGSGADTDASTDAGSGADTDTAFRQACVQGGNWYDERSGLCWQNPPTGYNIEGRDAISYCEELELETSRISDWRLPNIDELASLRRGCVDGVATGDLSICECSVDDPGCLERSCDEGPGCRPCPYLEGPGAGGCYWDPALDGSCKDWFWSASSVAEPHNVYKWYVSFATGVVNENYGSREFSVRCVTDGSDGDAETGCAGECGLEIYTDCTCGVEDPCGWKNNDRCDENCLGIVDEMFDDSEDCDGY